MAEESLSTKAKKSVLWSGIDKIASQLVQFIFGLLLARLLSPEAYGIIAMPMIFIAVSQCFIDCGFTTAIIRKPELKEEDLSTAFIFNIVVGIVCYTILFICSPWIAEFYETPVLTQLLRVTALATLFTPLSTVQQSILTRKLDFKTQTNISLSACLVSGIVGVIMAFYGCGVWSLVVQQVGAMIIRTVLLWSFSSWRPKCGWSKNSFSYLWNFGSKMLASGLINTIYNNIASIFIGKFYSPASLGNYTRAKQFADLPVNNFTGILDRVTIPVLSKIQSDDTLLANTYRRLIRLSAFIVFPLMMGLAALAEPLILTILGEQWSDCILLFQIVCFSSMWLPVHSLNLSLLGVKGRSDLFLKLEIIKKIFGVLLLIIFLPLGVVWFVSSFILSSIFSLIANTYYTGKLIDVSILIQLKDCSKSFLISLLVFLFIFLSTYFIGNNYIQLLVGCVAWIVAIVGLVKLFRCDELRDIVHLMPQRISCKITPILLKLRLL